MTSEPSTRTGSGAPEFRVRAAWIGLLAAAGLALRLLSARGDLWLDEIWSIGLAREAGSAWGVFTSLHHDNNHPLNTLWLRLLPGHPEPLPARALALLASAAALGLLAWRAARPRGSPPAAARGSEILVLALFAMSPLMVLYGSEARGYGPALACTVGALACMEAWLADPRPARALLLGAVLVLGLLCHLTFVLVVAALGSWQLLWWAKRREPRAPFGLALLAFGLPALALAALAWLDLRFMVLGGGPRTALGSVGLAGLGAVVGFPSGPGAWWGLGLATVAGWEGFMEFREGREDGLVHLLLALFLPALVLVMLRPAYAAPRYFLVGVPSLLTLLARALSRAWHGGALARGAALAAGAGLGLAHALALAVLLVQGRGHYRDAVAVLAAETPPGGAGLSSDHDFRNLTVLAYHAQGSALAGRLWYVPRDALAGQPPALWRLTHDFDPDGIPPARILDPAGRPYRLERRFRSAALSGWNWNLYRLVQAP